MAHFNVFCCELNRKNLRPGRRAKKDDAFDVGTGFANQLMDKFMVTTKNFAKAKIEAGCEITVLTPPENLKAMNEPRT